MRAENLHFLTYGALLAALVIGLTWKISSSLLRAHIRAPFLALSLGFIAIPGHGELIVSPLLAAFVPPIHTPLVGIGGVFFIVWWVVAAALLLMLRVATASRGKSASA